MPFVLKGFIRDLTYKPQLSPTTLTAYELSSFNVNTAKQVGIINLGTSENNLAFSRWITPKRTRSYPFAKIYDTFHLNTKHVTIIPIIKDEGKDTQNNDRINFITFSWMNLVNVYIILAWYEDAIRKPGDKERITAQKLNVDYVREKLERISAYHLSALHWNTTHFEQDFEPVCLNAVESYRRIADRERVELHSFDDHLKVLEGFKRGGLFHLDAFRDATLPRSHSAALRESVTSHEFERLEDGSKHLLDISNYLGGRYFLSPDEIYMADDALIIQESKNSVSKRRLPSIGDIKDGLFKAILYSSISELKLDKEPIPFRVQLKLTGGFSGRLVLPTGVELVQTFCSANRFTPRQTNLIVGLNREAAINAKVNIILNGNV
jgi:hypothetical protein